MTRLDDSEDRAIPVQSGRTRTERPSLRDLPDPNPRFAPRSVPPEPEEVPHLRYASTALVGSCAIVGAIGALIFAINEPAMLFVAAGVVLTVYFSLVILGKPAGR